MNILITNDDGISCNGILALEQVFKKKHNTFLIAPMKERSATSMALTVFDKMRVEKIFDDHYIVDGYPVDCVNIGLHGDIFPKIDLVLSGVNKGVNMGYDVLYSGTVGAARHAVVHGYYGIAISSGKVDLYADFTDEAEMTLQFVDTYFSKLKNNVVYSMNFPIGFQKDLSNFVPSRLGKRTYFDTYTKSTILGGVSEFFLGGSELGFLNEKDSDFDVYSKKLIPITAIGLNSTDEEENSKLKSVFDGSF
ncbi:MAG: 5'/3'-nucleotidase SurE [Leptospiraceae bacterium]|nr:5'/3'-nucleotidase SurE [Leptospiraceae bacterium]MCK6381770.1 5'/3'-nucleotidase SurE [Leptospiraceae bacterium]NUM42787.1 5'/3'-nucleotidase SurE [Leptospiraceae bacterium]